MVTRRLQGQIQLVGHIFSPHVSAEFPRDDVAAVVVKDRVEIEPTPADDLQMGEVRPSELVDRCGLVCELAGDLEHDEGGTSNQIMRLQHAVDRSL